MMKTVLSIVAVSALLTLATPAAAGSAPFLGERMVLAAEFCPSGWLSMDGQTLQISQYEDLFQFLGTTYGGDGQATFALPKQRLMLSSNGEILTQCIAYAGAMPTP
jgi:microcystin-dependent protein